MRFHSTAEPDSVDGFANSGHPDGSDRTRQHRRMFRYDDAFDAETETLADALFVMTRAAQLTAETHLSVRRECAGQGHTRRRRRDGQADRQISAGLTGIDTSH